MGVAASPSSLRWKVPAAFLYPLFLADLTRAFAEAPHEYAVTDGYRTLEDQSQRWARWRRGEGYPARAPGESPHNYGCAVHIVPLEGPDNYRAPAWAWVAARFPSLPVGDSRVVHARSRNRWEHLEWRRWESWKR